MDEWKEQLSVGSNLKLLNSSYWTGWINALQERTIPYDIWEYLNPENSDKMAKQALLSDPGMVKVAPSISQIRNEIENAPEGSAASRKDAIVEYTLLREEYQFWKERRAQYLNQRKGLAFISTFIYNSLPKQYQYIVRQGKDLRKVIQDLDQRFNPTKDPSYITRLRTDWIKHLDSINRNTSIEAWCNKTLELQTELDYAKEETYSKELYRKLLENILPINELQWFHATMYEQLLIERRDIPTQEVLRKLEREWSLRIKSKKEAPKGTFSTFQGTQEEKPVTQEENSASYANQRCPCLANNSKWGHKPWKCYILNPDIAPEGWKPPKQASKRARDAMNSKPSSYRDWLSKQIKQYNSKHNSNLNQSQPSQKANSSNSTVRTDSFSLQVHSQPNREEKPLIRVVKPSVDNGVNTSNWWILDCGSDCHVTNDASRFIDFTPIRGKLGTGDHYTEYEGIGTAKIYPIDPDNGLPHDITLKEVIYAPNFHLNLISESRLRKGGVCHDGMNNAVSNQLTGKILWNLTLKAGLWTFEPSPTSYHKKLNQKLTFNTQRGPIDSRNEHKSTIMYNIWHERLGHVGKRRIEMAS
ncbi:hypothetical protein N7470_002624 [Penicillium chermesinum]|nr:hypothetical protein N7470_002624 [Penicillium chermesinum]